MNRGAEIDVDVGLAAAGELVSLTAILLGSIVALFETIVLAVEAVIALIALIVPLIEAVVLLVVLIVLPVETIEGKVSAIGYCTVESPPEPGRICAPAASSRTLATINCSAELKRRPLILAAAVATCSSRAKSHAWA